MVHNLEYPIIDETQFVQNFPTRKGLWQDSIRFQEIKSHEISIKELNADAHR